MILVCGADGFIGCRLVNKLSLNQKVIALDKQFSNSFHENVITIPCDITQPDKLETVFKQYPIDAMVHLASLLNSSSNRNPSLATEVNILGSLNLLNLSKKYHVAKFIYGSSISIYGPLPSSRNNPVHEAAAVNPINIYGHTKQYVEFLGKYHKTKYNVDFISLRIATVIGKGVKNSASPWRSQLFEQECKMIEVPFKADEKLPLVHVDDVVDQIEILIGSDAVHDVYNTPSETISLREIASIVTRKNPAMQFIFGTNEVQDIPHYIEGNLFNDAFKYSLPSIFERL